LALEEERPGVEAEPEVRRVEVVERAGRETLDLAAEVVGEEADRAAGEGGQRRVGGRGVAGEELAERVEGVAVALVAVEEEAPAAGLEAAERAGGDDREAVGGAAPEEGGAGFVAEGVEGGERIGGDGERGGADAEHGGAADRVRSTGPGHGRPGRWKEAIGASAAPGRSRR
jgi:hypothetical protein